MKKININTIKKYSPLGGLGGIFLLLLSCSSPSIPTDATHTDKLPDIYPDYNGVTIPANLCPTNFMLPDCEEAVARLSFGDISFTYGDDNKIVIDEEEWQELCRCRKRQRHKC